MKHDTPDTARSVPAEHARPHAQYVAAEQPKAEQAEAGISVRDVTVTYRNGHTALWDASFEVPRGSITAILGVNGAGKSTLFKALMGFVPVARAISL